MTERVEIAVGALFLGVGLAGMPLEPLPILASILLCAVVAVIGGRFIAAGALIATVAVGFLQHHEFRISLLIAAAFVGLFARYAEARPRAATVLAAACAILGVGFLFLG